MENQWFQEQREQSLIKARIVSRYFKQWAYVMLGTQKKSTHINQRIAYVDLFAGPGRYDDQSKSTPLMVLETILADSELSERMIMMFNDKDAANIESLKKAINEVDGIDRLKIPPVFYNMEVGDKIASLFSTSKLPPTFFFVDPWGYKGLSLNLVSSIIKDWGCDCVFFFNYNRINMAVDNDPVKQHMASIFGESRLEKLRHVLRSHKKPNERELIVVQELCESLKDSGSQFVLPFRFKNDDGTRTSHHLIFLSKNFRGYEIMKEIMASESSDSTDGVANFEYNPIDARYIQGSLFDMLSRPLGDLQDMLLKEYSKKTVDFMELYMAHSVDKRYIKKNYKEVLRSMYDSGMIDAKSIKTGKAPRKGTFSDDMRITFGGTK
jgi:three-Cys-motif partner protein